MDENQIPEENYTIYNLHNPFPKDFRFYYGKKEWIIKGNTTAPFNAAVGAHGAKRLIDKYIEINHGFERINDKALRLKLLAVVLPGQDVTLEQIENVPIVKSKMTIGEGFVDGENAEGGKIEAKGEIMGENAGAEDLAPGSQVDPENDSEIDLNPGEITPENQSEEEMRMEALKDSNPAEYRAQELNKMDWNDLRALAKEKEVEGKNKEEIVKGIMKLEYPGVTLK
ncbi:MAG: hypothetical protein ACP5NS_05085 [Candidatus Pacearchaeota archaeon]